MVTEQNFSTLLAAFCLLLERQQQQRLVDDNLNCEANVINHKVKTKPGRKFVNVDIGTSGRYMVEIATGNIFGIKGYGTVHRGHFYGTLETTGEYNWGDYYPQKLTGTQPMQARFDNQIPALTFAPKPEEIKVA